MCNKKGKPVKDNRTPLIDPDYYDAVEVVETRKSYKVVFNIITIFGMSISSITDELFTIVDTVFDSLSLRKPDKAVVNIQGVMTKEGAVVKRDIEVEHIYD